MKRDFLEQRSHICTPIGAASPELLVLVPEFLYAGDTTPLEAALPTDHRGVRKVSRTIPSI